MDYGDDYGVVLGEFGVESWLCEWWVLCVVDVEEGIFGFEVVEGLLYIWGYILGGVGENC